jgi:predicted  nucleic acid-binding Zn-ribbon protein
MGWLISGVAAAVGGLASVVGGIGAALGVVGSAVAAILSPMGLVISAAVALAGTLLVTTDAGAEALSWLGDRFRALKDTVFKVIGGISDALAAGDIGLAAKILWLSLKLAWQEGVAALNRVWLEAKRFFIGTVQKMWYGALALSEQILHGLEVAWIETTAFLSRTWTSFTAGFKKAWNSAINWTTKRLLELQGLLDEGFDVEAAKRMADEDLADTNAEIDRQRDAALAAREHQRQSERDSARELNGATLAEIGRQFDEAQKALDDETNAKVAATRQALADARKQLDEAIAAARAKREAAESEPGVPHRKLTDPLAGLEDRLAGLGDVIARKISVTGTFNPAAIAGLGGGNAAERTARASEQVAKNTKRLVDAAITGGLTFA